MKKLLFVLSCLLVLDSAPVLAHKLEPEVVVVRVVEFNGRIKVSISRGSKEESIELELGQSEKKMRATASGYQKLIQQLYQEGFHLQSTFTTNASTSTLIFVKE